MYYEFLMHIKSVIKLEFVFLLKLNVHFQIQLDGVEININSIGGPDKSL